VEGLTRQTGIDLIVGNQFKLDLPSYLPPPHELRKRSFPEVRHTRTLSRESFDLPYLGEPDSTRALLKIQDGCSAMCSFCIIPFARGHERSRHFDDILREAESLASRGYREIVLTGVNIGQYRDGGHDFCALLRRLDRVAGIERIRISSIEPTTISTRLIELLGDSAKLCPFLHIPLQSGDDRILQAMNRRHSVTSYVTLVDQALAKIPELGLGTDLMVGFPGETDAAFQNTLAVAMDIPFSYLHIFPYSQRPGTAAMRMRQTVQPTTVRKRAETLLDLGQMKRLTFHNKQIGRTVSALFESGAQNDYRVGTTPNFTKVAVASSEHLENQIKPVTITAATERWAFGHIALPQYLKTPVTLL
jgi:threonylcarbamoyladenosine tRNA methylthiotransferase MtaB